MTKRTGDFSVVTNLLLVLLSLPISLWAQSEGNNVIYSGAAQAGSTAYIDATPYFNTSTTYSFANFTGGCLAGNHPV